LRAVRNLSQGALDSPDRRGHCRTSVRDIAFLVDPQQQFAYVIDGTNQQVYVLDRKSLKVLTTFGGAGHWAGKFYGAHNLAVNPKGDLFITETYEGKRAQKFVQTGTRKPG
jgi:hypothetical protein